MVKAFVEINTVKKTLNYACTGSSQFHGRVYNLAVELAKAVHVGESVPRTTGRQQHHVMCLLHHHQNILCDNLPSLPLITLFLK